MYLFLSSKDSLHTHPSNTCWDFTVTLPKTLNLNGKWVCSLADIAYSNKLKGKDLYIFCDLCEGSCIQGKILPILRIVDRSETFIKLYDMDVSRSQISQLRLYITGSDLQKPSFSSESLKCTLRLRKK